MVYCNNLQGSLSSSKFHIVTDLKLSFPAAIHPKQHCKIQHVKSLSSGELYLVLDALHWSSALRNNVARHLLASLGDCANLELNMFPLLQAVGLVRHPHDSKGIVLPLVFTWEQTKCTQVNLT